MSDVSSRARDNSPGTHPSAESELLWTPAPQRAGATQMSVFMRRMAQKYEFSADWESLRRWAIAQRGAFWSEMADFAGVVPSNPARSATEGDGLLGTKWFPGMTLNYARHMLRHDGDGDAILFEGELGQSQRMSHVDLRSDVARAAAALARDGVCKGDRVAGFMPNIPHTLMLMLAAASRGAIWSSCSPDFGVRGVLDRFTQIDPTVLLVTDGYSYGGKVFDSLPRVAEVVRELPSLRRLVIVPYMTTDAEVRAHAALTEMVGASGGRLQVSTWSEYLNETSTTPPLHFEEVPFDHPLFIMYSSGTTGIPKCIVHGHGGTLLQHMKELMLHTDLRAGERIFYFTTCGWMMWNWLVSGLGVGAAVVLFDGSPTHPTVHRLWEMAAKLRVNVFGTSPKFLGACQKAHLRSGVEHDLSALRAVLSTGSPLSEELFRYVYQDVKADVQLSSISGGTDIISCFMLGNPMLPVHAGEIQCRGLGMDVQAWDGANNPVQNQKGELVCCAPFPSQPVGFWNDADQRKYRAAYFEHFPDVWRHGDFIEIRHTGGIVVYGRSDATLNPGGIRIGTAEIYRLVESVPEVLDSIVVAKKTAEQDEEIALFVVLRDALKLDKSLDEKIRMTISAGATKRHVPRFIRQVTAIPHTISGKKVEMAVQQMIHGEEVKNRDALANPEALEQFRGILG